jgi:hypothetical protein
MKMTLVFTVGVGVGIYLASQMTEQQRSRVTARTSAVARRATVKVKESPVASSVGENAAKITGAFSDRVTDVVDAAGDVTADAIAPADDVASV